MYVGVCISLLKSQSTTLTSSSGKWTFTALICQQHICRENKTITVVCILEVSVTDTYPTNCMVQIKMDFQCFDSSTAIYFIV